MNQSNNDFLHVGVSYARGLSPVSVADNTAQVSEIIDCKELKAVEFVILTGSIADADATFVVLVEESTASDMAGATAVVDADLYGTETVAGFQFDDDNEIRFIGYRGDLRYCRLTITPAANASAALLSCIVVKLPMTVVGT